MVDTNEVRRALRQLRTDRAKLTPQQLADQSGVDRATIYRIEDLTAADYTPKIETISALAEAMGLSITGLFLEIESLRHHAPPLHSIETLTPPEVAVVQLRRSIGGESGHQQAVDEALRLLVQMPREKLRVTLPMIRMAAGVPVDGSRVQSPEAPHADHPNEPDTLERTPHPIRRAE